MNYRPLTDREIGGYDPLPSGTEVLRATTRDGEPLDNPYWSPTYWGDVSLAGKYALFGFTYRVPTEPVLPCPQLKPGWIARDRDGKVFWYAYEPQWSNSGKCWVRAEGDENHAVLLFEYAVDFPETFVRQRPHLSKTRIS